MNTVSHPDKPGDQSKLKAASTAAETKAHEAIERWKVSPSSRNFLVCLCACTILRNERKTARND